jgi:hypothetical protein
MRSCASALFPRVGRQFYLEEARRSFVFREHEDTRRWPFPHRRRVGMRRRRSQTSLSPNDGYVPNVHTAIMIAIAVWTPIYGAMQIATKKPYHVTPTNGVWTVTGSYPVTLLAESPSGKLPKPMVG